jgi:hypothetical protein
MVSPARATQPPKNAASTRQRAESALASHLSELGENDIFRTRYPTYTKTPEQNLVATVSVSDFWDDLLAGNGNELEDSPARPAKFCAAISSAALAVNVFGPFRHRPELLGLLGYSDFTECRFEKKLNTGISTANLDFFASGPTATICVESKCTETLSQKVAKFSPRYEKVVATLAESNWQLAYHELVEDPSLFKRLDTAQLVKHYLGMRHSLAPASTNTTLLYLYWEPLNAEEFSEFSEHRQELDAFKALVGNGAIRFTSMTYSELLRSWEEQSGILAEHRNHLIQRYEISI